MSVYPHKSGMCVAAMLAVVALWPAQSFAADPYTYNIISITNTAPGYYPAITFSVINNSTNQPADLQNDLAWRTTAGARLFLQIAWNTTDINNIDSNTLSLTPPVRGAAMPIPVNALAATSNGDGTYTAVSPRPIPITAGGSGEVAMEGHPAGSTPVRSVYLYFPITDSAAVPRREIVEASKCLRCHRTDGTGVAPRLTLHGSNRTDEPRVCVVCHNPNNTDIPFRGITTPTLTNTNPTVVVGRNTYREQGLDFKRFVHGIHATSAGFRDTPFVVVGRNGSIFDARTLDEFPANLKNCLNCHMDNGTRGTFELQPSGPPLGPGVLGSTMDTQSQDLSVLLNGTFPIDTDPDNNIRISPTAAACSSCHDDRETISHMVETGRASFNTTQAALNLGQVQERCNRCHGPGTDKSVRKVHGIPSLSSNDD